MRAITLKANSVITIFYGGFPWTERPWSKISADTGVGDPSKASEEKGKAFFNVICNNMAQLFHELASTDVNDLYE